MDILGMLFGNIFTAIVVVMFFGLTIFVHELGHFLVARWCGLQIKAFSIGFGPAIWQKEVDGVVYKIGCLPLGGYVALPQLDPNAMSTVQGASAEEVGDPLPYVAPWRKILVSVAGAACNVLLAIVFAWMVFLRGMPATIANQETVIGFIDPSSVMYEQGARIGDRILTVGGTPVEVWSAFVQEAAMYDEVELLLQRPDGSTLLVRVPTEPWQYGVHMVGGIDPIEPAVVDEAEPGMSAAEAGVLPGDEILSFAGVAVLGRAHMIALVRDFADQPQEMLVRRGAGSDGQEVLVTVAAAMDAEAGHPRIGIRFRMPEQQLDTGSRVYPRPMAQIRLHASAIFRFLRDLVRPRTSARAANMVGGPVAIIVYYYGMVQASLMLAVWFTGFLNINLAIINLLPIPVLDGGHIVFSLWEWVFRRPVHAKVINFLVNFFALLLIGVFLALTFRDVDRSPVGRRVRGFLLERDALEAVEPDLDLYPVESAVLQEGVGEDGGLD
ncbi:MAG: RIP metalloprotease RseP [Kiritimatiellia bacterium]